MRKYKLESYGCQLNMAEANALELLLKGAGFERTEDDDEASAVILNTCSVRKSAENRIWGRLSHYAHIKKKVHPIKIIVTGCMAERLKEDFLKEAPYVDAVVGTNDKMGIVNLLSDEALPHSEGYHFAASYHHDGDPMSYVPIMNGCNNFCSYCIVPYVRGREVSRPVDEVIREVLALEEAGVKEIMLLGQNVNSYSFQGVDFPRLLKEVAEAVPRIEFIRFDSPHPKDFSEDLVKVIDEHMNICRHIHLPMQSGSSRILKLMNRKAGREDFFRLVDLIRAGIKDVSFSTDVMVGFPTETEEEYEETLSAMERLSPIEAFMYYYNEREGTPAARMDGQIDEEVRTARLERLIDEQLKRASRLKSAYIGRKVRALVTGVTRDDSTAMLARDEHNCMTAFHPTHPVGPGDVVDLELEALKGNTFTGRML